MKGYFDIIGSPGRIPALDGLRAIAVLLVLLRHGVLPFNYVIDEFFFANPFVNLALNGWLGVDLFFVLSGFLISYHLLEQKRRNVFTIKRYALKRILRTVPLYYAVLVIAFAEIVPYAHANEVLSWSAISKYLLFLQDYLGASILVPLWSLAVEEKFYLIAPGLLFLLTLLPRGIASITIILLALGSVFTRYAVLETLEYGSYSEFFWAVRSPFHQCLDGIFLGMLVAWVVHKGQGVKPEGERAKYVFYCSLLAALVTLMAVPYVELRWWSVTVSLVFMTSGLFALMVWAAAVDERLSEGLLGGRFFRLIARLSYALYLTHYLFLPLALKCAQLTTGSVALFLFWLVYLGTAFLAAVLLHLIVEKPFLLLKAKIPS